MKKNVYRLHLQGNIEVPKKYKDLIELLSDVGKLFKKNSFKFVYITENDKFFKKLVNPRYSKVNEADFFYNQNIGVEGFILNSEDGKEYYINN